MTQYSIYSGVDHRGTVGKGAPGLFRPGGSVLADGLREPSRPPDVLSRAGDVGWAVEVLEGLDEGVVVRTAR